MKRDLLNEMAEWRPKTFYALGFLIIVIYAAFLLLTLALMVLGVVWLWRAVA